MKKAIAVIAVIAVVCVAGSAFAQTRKTTQPQQFPQRQGFEPCFCGRDDGRDFGGHRGHGFAPDMPKEIREKAVELAKLHVDLEEALTSRPVNKAKALDVHAKIQRLEAEIEAWRFAQRLDQMENQKIQRELNKRIAPKPLPKPAPKAEVKVEAEPTPAE